MLTRFRCTDCGNLTRFDVIATRRTREFHHFSVGGALEVDETEVVSEQIESVTCRWCGATGESILSIQASDSIQEGESIGEGDLQAARE